MGLLDYLQNARANYDRIREEQKKRSFLSQLGRTARAVIPDPLEQRINATLSPVFSSARGSARQAAVNTAASLPLIGPAVQVARRAEQYRALPGPARAEIEQNLGATASLAGKIGVGVLQGVGEFGARQMDRVFGFNGQRPLDVGGIARDVGVIPRDFLIRPTFRAGTGFATSGISNLMGIETPESIPAPTSKAGQFFLGTDPIQSAGGVWKSSPETAEALGYTPGFASNFAPILGVGLMASDLFPFNPKKATNKVAREVAEEAAKKTAREAVDSATSLPRKLPEASRVTLPGRGSIQAPSVELPKMNGEVSSFYNTDRLNIPQAGRDAIQAEIKNARTVLKKTVGETLTNKEVLDRAATTSRILESTVTREQTAAKIAADLKLRQAIADSAKTGEVGPEFIDLWIKDKAAGEDIARQLQARKIGADPKTASSIDSLLEAIRKSGAEADEIIEASRGVDFTNPEQVAAFYRKFVKPKASDWIDLVRYNSMLSSPTTHLVNIMSNFVNTGIVAPIEKTVSGVIDATRSAIFGTKRTHFAGEGLAYAKGYYSNLRTASQKFWDAFGQKTLSGNIDTRSIPMALEGTKARKAENVLAIPSRLLEAADQFAVSLVESGAESGLKYKAVRGVDVGDIAARSSDEAAYRLYRQRIGSRDEGTLLGALEFIPQKLLEARTSTNSYVRNISKWSFPFINTGVQMTKQGIEYGPLGLATLANHPRKLEQLSKTAIGTATALAIGTLIADDAITAAEPADPDMKNAFRAAGKLPYSIRVGDAWVQYSKLPPVLAWNFALVASVKEANENQKIDDGTADKILSIAAKYLNFFTDQSYMKTVGSVVDAVKGDKFALTNFATSLPQQLIPFRGLMSWVERAIDPVQRQADPDGTDLERSLQTMMAQIPGLANLVPPRMGPNGQPVENQNRILNALSPIKMTNENPEGARTYNDILSAVRTNQEETRAAADLRKRATKMDLEILALPQAERSARFKEIEATDPALADKIREVAKERALNLTELDRKIKELNIENGNRAKFVWEQLQSMSTDAQRAQYWDDLVKKGIITEEVSKQLRELIGK